MKKFLTLMLAALMAFCLFGCSNGGGEETSTEENYDLVFLADLGTIYDGGFNEYSFYGVKDFAEEKGLSYSWLMPAGDDDASRVTIFEQAVNQMKAKVIVAVGYKWDAALLTELPQYPDVKVVFADADNLYNIDADYDGVDDSIEHQDNLTMITFAEQECAWLAGYLVVKEGFRNLGFFGGMAVPAVIRFGYGFIEGAEAAAKELGLEKGAVKCNYYYTGAFEETPENVTFVSNWYTAGTEVVFSCGGVIVNNVISAAKDGENRWIVGVDCDEYYSRAVEGEECVPQIITSAMKDMEGTIYTAVKAAWEDGDAWKTYTDNCTKDGIIVADSATGGATVAPYRAENWKNVTEEDFNNARLLLSEIRSTLSTDADGVNGAPIEGKYEYVDVTYFAQ